ncbi:MAG: DUF4010 domain-containing protein [Bacteroidia bacterium]|nr:DUF4010 domain-containing protein [Bacteroidia bacterium]
MGGIEWTQELRFVVALGLGLLIGLERESSGADRATGKVFAGVRTYTIISLYGFACAWLYSIGAVYALPVGMLSVGAIALMGYIAKVREGRVGWTSEIAAMLTFVTGTLALLTDVWVPITLGVVSTMLLSEKGELEHFVDRLDKAEFLAVLKFLLITAIILPALPDRGYTRFGINPVRVWQIVILVSSLGFVGYVLTKRLGDRMGLWLSGLLGGIVSSTAVSIAAGRIAQRAPELSFQALRMAMLAGAVMYVRILVIVWAINPVVGVSLWWRCALLAVAGALLAMQPGKSRVQTDPAHLATLRNPFELRPALIFAAVFVLLIIGTSLARESFGAAGLLFLAVIVGLVDIDPFIVSLVQEQTHVATMVLPILLAMMSNTAAKGIYVAVLNRDARRQTLLRYALWAMLHVPLLLW